MSRAWASREVRGDVARLEEKRRDPPRDLAVGDADRDHAHPSGELVARGRDQTALESGERQGQRRPDGGPRRRPTVRRHPGGNVEGDDGPAAGVDQLDRPRDAAFGRAPRAGAEECVDDDVGPRQRARGAVGEAKGSNPAAPHLLELEPGVAADLGGREREQHRRQSAAALEPPRDDEPVTTVAALAADDDDPRAAAGRAELGQRGDDRFGRAATGVLHQGGSGNAQLGDRMPVEPPHLLGGEDAPHGVYSPGGSGPRCKFPATPCVRPWEARCAAPSAGA